MVRVRRNIIAILFPVFLTSCAVVEDDKDTSSSIQEVVDAESHYRSGIDLLRNPDDWEQANGLFHLAAIEGHVGANYMLGVSHLTGRGVEQDEAKAVKFFKISAKEGHANSLYQLGAAYINGRGVPKEIEWGSRWLGKAARKGHNNAKFDLGVAYATGLGLPVNNLKAWVWLKQAAEGEVAQASRVAEKVYTRLTPQEIKQLEKGRYRIDFDSGSDFADMPTVLFTQYRLGKLGYELGPVDGLMGSKTQEAINSFVRERNLNIPEVISEALLEELRATF